MKTTGRFLIGIAAGLFLRNAAQAQFTRYPNIWDAGIGAYATNYSGDLAPDHVSLANTRWGVGLWVRRHFNNTLQVRGGAYFGRLSGDDRHHPPNANRQFRFQTSLIEGSLQLEVSLFHIAYDPPRQSRTYYFTPYLFAGAGVAWFSPKATYYGPERDRPLFEREPMPEGGRTQYLVLVAPFGVGIRFMASDELAISAELGARPAPSDLLDGVSLNGNPKKKDWYYLFGLSCSYFIKGPWYLKE